ncbi:NAD-dependent epimerase [Flavobacterium orientale]|uniref:NAD-dependent epimerase n=1 Tax=Flavobacterium orientale TaxID=1756020 RepID=A0A916Y9E1_9FLAO|nr:NAD-dependent epimerase [Flavobacterium orientale]GGD36305.1 NAD-dependent epimerase [Flavobacterium orientale]
MTILVTGAAGFIGFHLTQQLLTKGFDVVGLDNLNDYYDPQLKYDRLGQLGIAQEDIKQNVTCGSFNYANFKFIACDLANRQVMEALFAKHHFDLVVNLAAQAGVRYSLEAPFQYIDSNVTGFLNILECCRHYKVKKLVYASSSSVYGLNDKVPFETTDAVDHPISLYAASKKANELMAHTYSHLFGIQTIGLRFFTVYGPWGRPDMAMFLFTDAILNNRPIKVFNEGNLSRDFTYIDDIVGGMLSIIETLKTDQWKPPYALYNIGNSKPVKLLDFIEAIEKTTGRTAQKEYLPMQPGDVAQTWADVSDLTRDFGYTPNTPISEGVEAFVSWYREYYNR